MYDLEKMLQYHIFSPEWANLLNIQQDNVNDQITRGRQTVKRHQIGLFTLFHPFPLSSHSQTVTSTSPTLLLRLPLLEAHVSSCLCLLLSSLPFSCWQDLIKAKVVLNLLCRVWTCTSDSPFLPPECHDSQCVPACTASSGFQDWSQASFVFSLCWAASVKSPPFPLCMGGRLHFRGRNVRGRSLSL